MKRLLQAAGFAPAIAATTSVRALAPILAEDGIIRDPALPHLGLMLDPVQMRERFAARFLAHGGDGWTLERCTIEEASHRPKRHCSVLYRLSFRSSEGGLCDEWVHAKAYAPDLARPRFEKSLAGVGLVAPLRPFLNHVPSVAFWNDLDLLVTVFPYDRKMPSLRRALDPRRVRWEVETHAGLLAPDLDRATASSGLLECGRLALDRIKYLPGKRCVVRYRATLEGAPDGPRDVSFIAKSYAIGRGGSRFQSHRRVCEQLRAQGSPVDLPHPLLYIDDLDTAWMLDWKGRPLLESLGEAAWLARVASVAEFLAALHRSRIEGIPAARTPRERLDAALEDGVRFGRAVPALAALARRMRDRLESRVDRIEAPGVSFTPTHGACRADQMLFRHDRVTLVDFDNLAIGDPLQDVAEWIVSLEFLAIRQGHRPADLEAAAHVFARSYQESVPWSCDRARIGWYAVAALTSKMAGLAKHLDFAALRRLIDRGEPLADRWIQEIG